jgi:hypothetical protein
MMAIQSELDQLRDAIASTTASLVDLRDLPPLSQRQRDQEEERRLRLPQLRATVDQLTEQYARAQATITTLTPVRDRLVAAQQRVEQQLAAATDDRDRLACVAARDAIVHGVRTGVNGPVVPRVLRALLTDRCSHCGHESLTWAGSLPHLEQQLEEARRTLDTLPSSLAWVRTAVASVT